MLFHLAIFGAAFLTFAVQPAAAKVLLPYFGGSASVWSAALLFFQSALLVGYGYSWLMQRFLPRTQAGVHVLVLLVAFLLSDPQALFFGPGEGGYPAGQILWILALGLGPVFCLLSSTSPLLQQWASWIIPGSPYRFYATSNAGSLLALLLYPIAIEPYWGLRSQIEAWFWMFLGVAGLVLACGFLVWGHGPFLRPVEVPDPGSAARLKTPAGQWLPWIGWPMLGCVLLLGFTNHICRDIASVPFLWILPLAAYLLSFIFCFAARPWYPRRRILGGFMVLAVLYSVPWTGGVVARSWVSIPVNVAALFLACMIAHGELVRTKPDAPGLTRFYFGLSLGGALGGVLVNFLAPLVFSDYYELPLAVAGLATWVLFELLKTTPDTSAARFRRLGWMFAQAMVLAFAFVPIWHGGKVLAKARNFYGTIRVMEEKGVRQLKDGRILHGAQYLDPARAREPMAYYGERSGSGLVFKALEERNPRKIALIGLGAGCQTVFARQGDDWHVFELNPDVLKAAQTQFSYVRESPASRMRLVLGDGRKALELSGERGFDVILLDAFSGDAVPVHLLTEEAFTLYLDRLNPGGYLVAHITNGHVNLRPLMRAIADRFGLEVRITESPGEGEWIYPATYALFKRGAWDLAPPGEGVVCRIPDKRDNFRLWTDDYSNLLGLLYNPFQKP